MIFCEFPLVEIFGAYGDVRTDIIGTLKEVLADLKSYAGKEEGVNMEIAQ